MNSHAQFSRGFDIRLTVPEWWSSLPHPPPPGSKRLDGTDVVSRVQYDPPEDKLPHMSLVHVSVSMDAQHFHMYVSAAWAASSVTLPHLVSWTMVASQCPDTHRGEAPSALAQCQTSIRVRASVHPAFGAGLSGCLWCALLRHSFAAGGTEMVLTGDNLAMSPLWDSTATDLHVRVHGGLCVRLLLATSPHVTLLTAMMVLVASSRARAMSPCVCVFCPRTMNSAPGV